MSRKKGRIITVEGCPCEVVQRISVGELVGNDATGLAYHNYIAIAPDGALIIAVDERYTGAVAPSGGPMFLNSLFTRDYETRRNALRRLARELNA